jgi:hypothetical protein
MENLGQDALSPAMWMAIYEYQGPVDLLGTAAAIDPALAGQFAAWADYILSTDSTIGFHAFVQRLTTVTNVASELNLGPDEVSWLFADAFQAPTVLESVAGEVNVFLNNHSLETPSAATEAARIYIHLHQHEPEFVEFELEYEEAPVWWGPYVKEIAKEAILELLRRRVNGSIAGLPQDLIDAIDAISSGDVLGFLGEALDIAKLAFPALQGIDTFFDGVELIGNGTRAWRAIAKLKDFGEEVIQHVLTVVRTRTGGLLGKFQWGGSSTGIKVLGIPGDTAFAFFMDLVTLFPGAVSHPNTSHPNNTAYAIPGGIILEYQPSSSSAGSGGVPSIQIKKQGLPTIKLRLNP